MWGYCEERRTTFDPGEKKQKASLNFSLVCERQQNVRWPTTVTAKEITSRQKIKTRDKRRNLTAERKRLAAKEITSRPRLTTVSLFFLPRGFFREVTSFAVTVVSHRKNVITWLKKTYITKVSSPKSSFKGQHHYITGEKEKQFYRRVRR